MRDSELVVETEEPGRIKIWAGNWLCTYVIRNNQMVRTEKPRYQGHLSARPDEFIEAADDLAQRMFAAQKRGEKKHGAKSSAA